MSHNYFYHTLTTTQNNGIVENPVVMLIVCNSVYAARRDPRAANGPNRSGQPTPYLVGALESYFRI